jgi:hypothetical protein
MGEACGPLAVTSEWIVVRGGHGTHIDTTVTDIFRSASSRPGLRLRAPSHQIVVIVMTIVVVMFTGWRVKELVQGIPTRDSNLVMKGCLYVFRPVFVALLLLSARSAQMLLLIMSAAADDAYW